MVNTEKQREEIGILVWDNAQRMRGRMWEKLDGGVAGWNDIANLSEFKRKAVQKAMEGDWIDAENYIMMILYLEQMKQLQESAVT